MKRVAAICILGAIFFCFGFAAAMIDWDAEPVVVARKFRNITANVRWAANDYYISKLPADALHPMSWTEGGFGRYQTEIGMEHYYYPSFAAIEKAAECCRCDGSLWVREDGVVMYGDYVVVASDEPYGTILPTSLGDGIVLDVGQFDDVNKLDVATVWW